MSEDRYDLRYDPNDVGGNLIVECWLSHSPRAHDQNLHLQPADVVMVGDDEEAPLLARVVHRQDNRVWVQLQLPSPTHAVA